MAEIKENPHLGHREKLRQRFIHENGFEHFEDHQILELLLFYANTRNDMNPVAHALLNEFGSLKGVLEARPEMLMNVPGVGEKAATLISTPASRSGSTAIPPTWPTTAATTPSRLSPPWATTRTSLPSRR